MDHALPLLMYHIYPNVRQPHSTLLNFQEDIYTEHFNFVHNYKVTSHFLDGELGKRLSPILA
jgi:hypothetical protein